MVFVEPDAGGLAEVDGEADAFGLPDADADGDGLAEAPILRALAAWPEPDEDVALADADGDGLVDLAPAFAEDDGVGVVAAAVVVFGATSSTCRRRSSAVSPTRVATFCAPAPGTETTISSEPC